MTVTLLYTTWPDHETAEACAAVLLDEGLIACANLLGSMRSIYRWKGKVEKAVEVVMILKTVPAKADALLVRVGALHPYDVPAMIRLDGEASAAFGAWIDEETAD